MCVFDSSGMIVSEISLNSVLLPGRQDQLVATEKDRLYLVLECYLGAIVYK